MILTSRLRRRLAGLGLASVAVLLPTAALASPAGSSSASSARTAAVTAVPICRAVNTRVWYGLPADLFTGHAVYQVQISDIGHSTCRLSGYPRVLALNGHNRQVGLPATDYGRRIDVILRPRGTAHVVLVAVNAYMQCNHPIPATQITVPEAAGR